jgi:hypothetical protein
MKKLFQFVIILCLFTKSFSQTNLVPNWSFEDTISCPQVQGYTFYSYTPPWFSPNRGTPDILNECSPWPINIPYNNGSFQYAHTGKGMADFAWDYSDNCEFLSVKLLNPLKAGGKYCVAFYINLENWAYMAIDRIGAYISIDSIYVSTFGYLHYIPQIENPAGIIIKDTLNWTLISGEFIASGGEQYITIGCFRPDSMVQTELHDTIHGDITHYFLDDVSVYDCSDTTGINKFSGDKSYFNFYPNPATDKITIEASKKSEIEILTVSGQLIKNVKADEVNETIDVSGFARGIYFVKVKTGKGIEMKKLILL